MPPIRRIRFVALAAKQPKTIKTFTASFRIMLGPRTSSSHANIGPAASVKETIRKLTIAEAALFGSI
ncbi:MAG: hypothetical protein JWP25_1186 [Bradyrhizobium sp.]|nr:hypothetical protein [Bradyrhizobium sp.]